MGNQIPDASLTLEVLSERVDKTVEELRILVDSADEDAVVPVEQCAARDIGPDREGYVYLHARAVDCVLGGDGELTEGSVDLGVSVFNMQ